MQTACWMGCPRCVSQGNLALDVTWKLWTITRIRSKSCERTLHCLAQFPLRCWHAALQLSQQGVEQSGLKHLWGQRTHYLLGNLFYPCKPLAFLYSLSFPSALWCPLWNKFILAKYLIALSQGIMCLGKEWLGHRHSYVLTVLVPEYWST